jgi:hypothetical protein
MFAGASRLFCFCEQHKATDCYIQQGYNCEPENLQAFLWDEWLFLIFCKIFVEQFD